MDDAELCMIRQRAVRRARTRMKAFPSLWGFENWPHDPIEAHHVGGRLVTFLIDIPVSLHRELTRRRMEEHPPTGLDLGNPVVQQGMLHYDMCDLYEGLAAGHRYLGDLHFAAARSGDDDLMALEIHEDLLNWLCRIAKYLAKLSEEIFGTAEE